MKVADFHRACLQGDLDSIQRVLNLNPRLAYQQGEKKASALHFAAKGNQLEACRIIIEAVLAVRSRSSSRFHLLDLLDENGNTALHVACQTSSLPIVSLLLQHGALNLPNEANKSPLMNASEMRHLDICQSLTEHYFYDHAHRCYTGATVSPMVIACMSGFVEFVDWLLEIGFELHNHKLVISGFTLAISYKQNNLVNYLLKTVMIEKDCLFFRRSALQNVVHNGDVTLFARILRLYNDYEVDLVMTEVKTARSNFTIFPALVASLVEFGCNMYSFLTLPHRRINSTNPAQYLLMEAKFLPTLLELDYISILPNAVTSGDQLRLIMTEGLDLDDNEHQQEMILQSICSTPTFAKCNEDFVHVVLDRFHDALPVQRSVFHLALRSGISSKQHNVVQQLLNAGASANYTHYVNDQPPLVYAAVHSNTAMVELLLRHGGDVNSICTNPRDRRSTALLVAVSRGNICMINALLRAGADINQHGSYKGRTALQKLMKIKTNTAQLIQYRLQAAELLLKAGADLNLDSPGSESALRMAEIARDNDMLALFDTVEPTATAAARAAEGETVIIMHTETVGAAEEEGECIVDQEGFIEQDMGVDE